MQTMVLAAVIVVVTVVASIAGLLITRRFFKPEDLQRHHDVAGFIIAIIGLIYGVLLAFVVFDVWSQYDDAQTAVEHEANGVADLYRLAYGFPNDVQAELRGDIRNYLDDVVGDEWQTMYTGHYSLAVERSADQMWAAYETMDPQTRSADSALYSQSLSRLVNISDSRHDRLLAAQDSIPSILWLILIFGGASTVAFTYFFGVENLSAQALMTALLAALIALVLFLIYAFEHPFAGPIRIPPTAFQHTLARFTTIETHEKERETVRKAKGLPAKSFYGDVKTKSLPKTMRVP
jgi:hypothetical protein